MRDKNNSDRHFGEGSLIVTPSGRKTMLYHCIIISMTCVKFQIHIYTNDYTVNLGNFRTITAKDHSYNIDIRGFKKKIWFICGRN